MDLMSGWMRASKLRFPGNTAATFNLWSLMAFSTLACSGPPLPMPGQTSESGDVKSERLEVRGQARTLKVACHYFGSRGQNLFHEAGWAQSLFHGISSNKAGADQHARVGRIGTGSYGGHNDAAIADSLLPSVDSKLEKAPLPCAMRSRC